MSEMLTTFNPFMVFETGEGSGGSGEPTPQTGNPPAPQPNPTPPAPETGQSEVEKAYAKLREAEKERDKAQAAAKRLERQGLSETEQIKAERDDLQAQVAGLTMRISEMESDSTIAKVASDLKFRNTTVAKALAKEQVPAEDRNDETKVRKALEKIASEDPTLVGAAAPPSGGPITPGGESGNGGAQGFTELIRQSAGR